MEFSMWPWNRSQMHSLSSAPAETTYEAVYANDVTAPSCACMLYKHAPRQYEDILLIYKFHTVLQVQHSQMYLWYWKKHKNVNQIELDFKKNSFLVV